MRHMLRLLAVAVIAATSACGSAKPVSYDLLNVSSSSNAMMTDSFTAHSTWSLTYQWDCAKARVRGNPNASGFGYVLYNADDDSTAYETPKVDRHGTKGNGTVPYQTPGQYYLQISTPCEWQVTAVTGTSSTPRPSSRAGSGT